MRTWLKGWFEMDSDVVRVRPGEFQSPEEWAASAYLRQGSETWSSEDQVEFDFRLRDPAHLKAYQDVANAWQALGRHALAPELESFRREAVERSRRKSTANRFERILSPGIKWATAASLVVMVGLAGLVFLSSDETVYETGIGEQRTVELADRSRLVLDAKTSVRVRLTSDSRVVELADGQVQFMVARDPRRPFRVDVGEHTITAVGTSFNVDHTDRGMQVAMVEGKVVVSVERSPRRGGKESRPAASIESSDLVAGQALRVDADGRMELLANADIAAAIAWRQGKIILTDTTLGEAVRRFNRYSRMQIVIDGSEIETLRVSGVFEIGDTQAFIEAIQASLPIAAVPEGADLMRLRPI